MLYSGLVRHLALSCALLAIPALAVAQFDSGSFIGTVHDSAGAVVPDATVVVTNPQTGVSVTRTTDSSGAWEVPSLHTGTYTVKISHGGFSDAAANDVTLSVGARQRIDLTLNAAGSSETVEVSGVALQLETENSERGQTITGYQSAALPLVSRNYSDLLGLVTGDRARLLRLGDDQLHQQRSSVPALTTSTASAACSITSCSMASTTTPTARATRASIIRLSRFRRTRSPSSRW